MSALMRFAVRMAGLPGFYLLKGDYRLMMMPSLSVHFERTGI